MVTVYSLLECFACLIFLLLAGSAHYNKILLTKIRFIDITIIIGSILLIDYIRMLITPLEISKKKIKGTAKDNRHIHDS